jgi:hypothetical protein
MDEAMFHNMGVLTAYEIVYSYYEKLLVAGSGPCTGHRKLNELLVLIHFAMAYQRRGLQFSDFYVQTFRISSTNCQTKKLVKGCRASLLVMRMDGAMFHNKWFDSLRLRDCVFVL